MATNHDEEYFIEYHWPKDKYWTEVTSFKPCERERLAIEAEEEHEANG